MSLDTLLLLLGVLFVVRHVRRGSMHELLRPINSIPLYYIVNTIIGHWALVNGYIYKESYFIRSFSYNYVDEYSWVIAVLAFAFFLFGYSAKTKKKSISPFTWKSAVTGFVIVFTLVESLKLILDIGLLEVPKYYFFVISCEALLREKPSRFWTFFAMTVFVSFVVQIDSKREILVFILAGVLIYANYHSLKTKTLLLYGSVMLFLCLATIITGSIVRGWGDGQEVGFNRLTKQNISLYLRSDNLPNILNNTETTATYKDGLNGYAYAQLHNPDYDLVLRTALFLFPSFILPFEKPPNLADDYGKTLFPSDRKLGYSRTSTGLTEYLWSFGTSFGVFFFLITSILLDQFSQRACWTYGETLWINLQTLFAFARGSGLDLYLQYIFTFLIIRFLWRLLTKKAI